MVPVWISPPPRDVATQTQQRTKAEIFQFRHGTYFSQIVELFRAFVPTARNRRLIVTGATTYRHGTNASSTWFVHAACHKKFLCGRAIRLRVPCVVTLCGGPEWGGGSIRARRFDTHGRSLRLCHPSPCLRLSLCAAAAGVARCHPRRGARRRRMLGRHPIW